LDERAESHHHCVAQAHTFAAALLVMHTQPSVLPPSIMISHTPLAEPVHGVVQAAPLAVPAGHAIMVAGAE
jgi:hypothetical protein